jgi:hypothetical protein
MLMLICAKHKNIHNKRKILGAKSELGQNILPQKDYFTI